MYLVGTPHPNKDRAALVLSQLVRDEEELVTGVEVFQEILHRYAAIDRLDSVDPALASLESVTDQVLSFDVADVRAAKVLIELDGAISARDALHVAVMKRAGIDRIFSFDRGFDGFPDIQRVF